MRLSEDLDAFSMPILEMANISQADHKLGIDFTFHVQQPGDKLPPHFANVKVFRGDFSTTDMKFAVSIPDLKIIKGSHDWLSKKELKQTMDFIKANKDNFLKLFKDQGLAVSDLTWT